jgi:hypothetical protein
MRRRATAPDISGLYVSMEVPDGMIRAPNRLFEPRRKCDYEKINDSVKRMSRGADLRSALRESGLFSFFRGALC